MNNLNSSIDSETKKLNFKYNKYFYDRLWILGIFVICFGVLLSFFLVFQKQVCEIELGKWKVALMASIFFICLIVAMFAAARLSAIITENDGEAIFSNNELELVLKKQKIQIRYNEVVKIEFKKIVGSVDGWSFLPIGKMKILLANSRKIEIVSSRREAQKLKREYGLVWKYKLNKDGSAPVPDILLWKVCLELSERTKQTIYIDKVIETNLG